MRRAAALLGCLVALASCGSGDRTDAARERLNAADEALSERPRDPRAMEEVIRVALAGANDHVDAEAGVPTAEARPFYDRAAAVWPRYLAATRDRPRPAVAATMVQVYGNGLSRPREAARAASLLADAQPTSDSYLQLVVWSSRAGDARTADLAGQKALELADPQQRERVRAAIRTLVPAAP